MMDKDIFSLENTTFSILNLTEEKTKLYLNENKDDFKSLSTSEAIDFYARKWSEKAKFFLLKNDNDKLLSLIVFYINVERKILYIPFFVVSRNYRNKGLGHKMLNYLSDYYRDVFHSIELEVSKENIKAYKFYFKEDFIIKTENKDSYLMTRKI